MRQINVNTVTSGLCAEPSARRPRAPQRWWGGGREVRGASGLRVVGLGWKACWEQMVGIEHQWRRPETAVLLEENVTDGLRHRREPDLLEKAVYVCVFC